MPEFTGVITEPGLYQVPEHLYHRDPVPGDGSLSHSGIKNLIPPNCPAIFKWERDHPRGATKAMDLGSVVHSLVLGNGADVEILDFPNYQTKKAQEAKAAAIKAGKIPQLTHQYAEAEAIAQAVKERDNAAALFSDGDPELSGFWFDREYSIWGRLRIDWLTYIASRPTIVDFKTAADASPEARGKSAGEHGYILQDPYYRRGLAAILGCDPLDIDFIFVVVQTTPPYIVQEHRLLPTDTERGLELCRIGMEKFRHCTDTGQWPPWSDEIDDLPLAGFQRTRAERIINDWHTGTYQY